MKRLCQPEEQRDRFSAGMKPEAWGGQEAGSSQSRGCILQPVRRWRTPQPRENNVSRAWQMQGLLSWAKGLGGRAGAGRGRSLTRHEDGLRDFHKMSKLVRERSSVIPVLN